MAVPMDSLLLRNRLVRAGDSIDIVGSFSLEKVGDGAESPGEYRRVENMEVHAIIAPKIDTEEGVMAETTDGEFGSSRGGYAVLLALDIQDALVLRHILDAAAFSIYC